MNIHTIMQQAQKLQERLQQIQEELGEKTVTASAGGGMVEVVANGKQEILSITIAPEAVDPRDIPMLQDLVVAAVNQALKASRQLLQDEMLKITGGIRIPGITP
ncbi:MAG: YbaB/EbfC family nucleoid-associated protein [Desulfobacterota bacterium]|nr:YbaB/EbfC family nucleoid-associated protein [Thermodesulfobacteriota bacterium]